MFTLRKPLIVLSVALTAGLLCAANKPVKPPPPTPTVQFQLIDLGVGRDPCADCDVMTIDANGVVLGNAGGAWAQWSGSGSSGNWCFADVPYVIVPEWDAASGKAVWFRGDEFGNNALISPLPKPEGDFFAVGAMGVNTAGMIVGVAWHCDGVNEPTGSLVCWFNRKVFDLKVECWSVNSLTSTGQLLVSAPSGWLVVDLDVADDGTVFVADSVPLDPGLEAASMNEAGDVVGYNYNTNHAFLLRGAATDAPQLISLPVANSSSANDLNSIGTVVGYGTHIPKGQGSYSLACKWGVASGAVTTTELNVLPGISGKWTSYEAYSVNDQNQIVGECSYPESGNYLTKSFFWQNGSMMDLCSLLAGSPSDVTSVEPWKIIKAGVIVGRFERTTGVVHACVLVPVTP